MNDNEAVADLKKCGAGSADCCIFLVVAATGAQCARFTPVHNTLTDRAGRGLMKAQHAPTAPYPDCQPNNEATT